MSTTDTTIDASQGTDQTDRCVVCLEHHPALISLACPDHSICGEDLVTMFERAIKSKSDYPPTCCNKDQYPIDPHRLHDLVLSDRIVEEYEAKSEEYQEDRPRYCANRVCSKFLPPRTWAGGMASCKYCKTMTCPRCMEAVDSSDADAHDCSHVEGEANAFQHFVTIKPCPSCNTPIELAEACNHMACTECRHEYCFICSAPFSNGCRNRCPTHGHADIDEEGYTKDWHSSDGFRPGGFHKDTGFNRAGFDRSGFNKDGISGTGQDRDNTQDNADRGGFVNEWDNDDEDDVENHHEDDPCPETGLPDWVDPVHLEQWRAQRMVDHGEIDWNNLPPDARAEHEMIQMQLDIDRGVFAPINEVQPADPAWGHDLAPINHVEPADPNWDDDLEPSEEEVVDLTAWWNVAEAYADTEDHERITPTGADSLPEPDGEVELGSNVADDHDLAGGTLIDEVHQATSDNADRPDNDADPPIGFIVADRAVQTDHEHENTIVDNHIDIVNIGIGMHPVPLPAETAVVNEWPEIVIADDVGQAMNHVDNNEQEQLPGNQADVNNDPPRRGFFRGRGRGDFAGRGRGRGRGRGVEVNRADLQRGRGRARGLPIDNGW